MHCLREGDWGDEDKCPSCADLGHTSPWRVSACPACNKEFFDAIARIKQKIDDRQLTTPDGLYCLDHSI